MEMTRGEFCNDCKREGEKATVKLPSVMVTVVFSGVLMVEYENCTEEQAIEMAREDFKSERVSYPTAWLKEYHKTMYKIYQDAFKDVVIKGKK